MILEMIGFALQCSSLGSILTTKYTKHTKESPVHASASALSCVLCTSRLLLQIIKVVLHRPLIRARHFFLAQRTLGVGLGGGGGFLVLDVALTFDADALQSDARHLAAG